VGDESESGKNVDIKIPILLLKAGMKLGSLVPDAVRLKIDSELSEKELGVDLSKLKPDEIDAMVQSLTESAIRINSEKENVNIYCC
jgi:hypothetical protein